MPKNQPTYFVGKKLGIIDARIKMNTLICGQKLRKIPIK